MAYYVMLDTMLLPITPSAISMKFPSLNKTVNLVSGDEINIPKKCGLREFSFEFLAPNTKYPFTNAGLLGDNFVANLLGLGVSTASDIVPQIKFWKNMGIPVWFIVVRLPPNGKLFSFASLKRLTVVKCLIEDFTVDEDAEAHGMDMMCSIELREYKEYGTKRYEKKDESTGTVQNTRSSDKKTKSKVKTQEGDTIPNIAKKETGSFQNWRDVAAENNYQAANDALMGSVDSLDTTDPFNDLQPLEPMDAKGDWISISEVEDSIGDPLTWEPNTLLEPMNPGATINMPSAGTR